MYCNNCGKQIADHAKFCNFCGSKVEAIRPQSASAAPQQQAAPQRSAPAAPAQPAAPKKKNTTGKLILRVLVIFLVYFAARFATETFLTRKVQTPEPTTASTSSGIIEINPSARPALTESCLYGALYQNGDVTYGLARLHMPGYSLLPGEGDERDWLMSEDETCLFSAYKQLEVMGVSFSASTEEAVLKSYDQEDCSVTMVDFQSLYVDGFPVIRYIVHYIAADTDQYVGELIVFPSEDAKETLRMSMFKLAETGYDEINRVFDSLTISPDYALTAEDSQVIGLNRITVK